MKKFITILLMVTLVLSNITTAHAEKSNKKASSDIWPSGPDVYSEAAIVMDASSGLILYEKNIHDQYYPASITKILTTLLAIENCSLNEIVTFSKSAIFGIERNSSHIGIDVGEQLTVEQCLYGIMLESANEVAYAIAEHVAGDMESFADMMNKKAKELGCTDSNFVNSNGLHDDDHYTSAYDMALIAKAAINNSTFRKVTSTVMYTIPPTNIQSETRYLNNHHKMLKNTSYHYDGCIGGKTGYTTKSGNTLVTYAKQGDLELICVVMRSDSTHQYTDTAKLLDFGFGNYTAYDITTNSNISTMGYSPFFTRYNTIFDPSTSPLQTSGKSIVVLPNSADPKDVVQNTVLNNITSLEPGINTIGTITYSYKDKVVGSTNITYDNTEKPTLETKGKNEETGLSETYEVIKPKSTLKPLIAGCIIAVLIIMYLLYYFFVTKPRRKKNAYYRNRRNSNYFH